jgi:hypothetical protein
MSGVPRLSFPNIELGSAEVTPLPSARPPGSGRVRVPREA